jgi:hypothetical protein
MQHRHRHQTSKQGRQADTQRFGHVEKNRKRRGSRDWKWGAPKSHDESEMNPVSNCRWRNSQSDKPNSNVRKFRTVWDFELHASNWPPISRGHNPENRSNQPILPSGVFGSWSSSSTGRLPSSMDELWNGLERKAEICAVLPADPVDNYLVVEPPHWKICWEFGIIIAGRDRRYKIIQATNQICTLCWLIRGWRPKSEQRLLGCIKMVSLSAKWGAKKILGPAILASTSLLTRETPWGIVAWWHHSSMFRIFKGFGYSNIGMSVKWIS